MNVWCVLSAPKLFSVLLLNSLDLDPRTLLSVLFTITQSISHRSKGTAMKGLATMALIINIIVIADVYLFDSYRFINIFVKHEPYHSTGCWTHRTGRESRSECWTPVSINGGLRYGRLRHPCSEILVSTNMEMIDGIIWKHDYQDLGINLPDFKSNQNIIDLDISPWICILK